MLLEVLISILLFALGFVALMGLQSRSMAVTSDLEYRAEVVRITNAYVAKMWAYQATGTVGSSAAATLQTNFQTNGDEYVHFRNQIVGNPEAKSGALPGIPGALDPVVVISPNPVVITLPTGANLVIDSVDVSITVQWVERNTDNTEPVTHTYTQQTSIGFQPVTPQSLAAI
ncbi:MAG: hypothetical protein LBG61_00585 [Burkholderiales bacterium]|jgi:type IV pilus assembly protein PilV|nr:hypothetical protein [Burkholderiales bacterium]